MKVDEGVGKTSADDLRTMQPISKNRTKVEMSRHKTHRGVEQKLPVGRVNNTYNADDNR